MMEFCYKRDICEGEISREIEAISIKEFIHVLYFRIIMCCKDANLYPFSSSFCLLHSVVELYFA